MVRGRDYLELKMSSETEYGMEHVREELLFRTKISACYELDFTNISGTNCYLDPEARQKISCQLAMYPVEGIHYIGDGNYHYMSLLFLERITEDFALVVFDHHPDMQEAAFGGITSCGGWVREAMEELPHLKRVYLLGCDRELVGDDASSNSRLSIYSVQTPKDTAIIDEGLESVLEEELPLFLSLDFDVLRAEDYLSSWSPGILPAEDFYRMYEALLTKDIIGIDYCG